MRARSPHAHQLRWLNRLSLPTTPWSLRHRPYVAFWEPCAPQPPRYGTAAARTNATSYDLEPLINQRRSFESDQFIPMMPSQSLRYRCQWQATHLRLRALNRVIAVSDPLTLPQTRLTNLLRGGQSPEHWRCRGVVPSFTSMLEIASPFWTRRAANPYTRRAVQSHHETTAAGTPERRPRPYLEELRSSAPCPRTRPAKSSTDAILRSRVQTARAPTDANVHGH